MDYSLAAYLLLPPRGYCQLIINEITPPPNRTLSRCSGRNLGARDLLPCLKSSVTGDPVLSGFQTMAARTEEIVDTGMNREKALRLAGRLESAHLALLLACRLVRNLRLIIQALVLAVLDTGENFFAGRTVAA